MGGRHSQCLEVLTHTRIIRALLPMVPQVPSVTLGSSLCPWCSPQGEVHDSKTNFSKIPQYTYIELGVHIELASFVQLFPPSLELYTLDPSNILWFLMLQTILQVLAAQKIIAPSWQTWSLIFFPCYDGLAPLRHNAS